MQQALGSYGGSVSLMISEAQSEPPSQVNGSK